MPRPSPSTPRMATACSHSTPAATAPSSPWPVNRAPWSCAQGSTRTSKWAKPARPVSAAKHHPGRSGRPPNRQRRHPPPVRNPHRHHRQQPGHPGRHQKLELYSAKDTTLRIQGSATAKAGAAHKIGGNLHLQAADVTDIKGNGSGDLTLHQGGGGLTIKPDGTIRLFGNTVTLKSQSGVTFNGNMERVPVPVVADSPVPTTALAETLFLSWT